jgi:hypothetical protein
MAAGPSATRIADTAWLVNQHFMNEHKELQKQLADYDELRRRLEISNAALANEITCLKAANEALAQEAFKFDDLWGKIKAAKHYCHLLGRKDRISLWVIPYLGHGMPDYLVSPGLAQQLEMPYLNTFNGQFTNCGAGYKYDSEATLYYGNLIQQLTARAGASSQPK